jgi:hypothetical protein
MFSRFDPSALFLAHHKGLSIDQRTSDVTRTRADKPVRAVLYGGDAVLGAVALYFHWGLESPGAILSGVALLAGGLLGAFGQLSTLRLKLTESMIHQEDSGRGQRAMLDETVAHLLLAAYLCAVDAVLLIIALNVTRPNERVGGPLAAAVIMVTGYVVALFLIAIPRLYGAYAEMNKVSDQLSGLVR